MKTVKTLLAAFAFIFLSVNVQAQGKKTETVKIKTSSVCDMCKTTIEKGMAYEKGVQAATLDVASQMLTIQYRADKTSVDALKKALTEIGYDANETPANARAYNKLNDCCKKDKGIH